LTQIHGSGPGLFWFLRLDESAGRKTHAQRPYVPSDECRPDLGEGNGGGLPLQGVFGELGAVGAKGVGQEELRSGGKVLRVDTEDGLRVGQVELVEAVAEGNAKVRKRDRRGEPFSIQAGCLFCELLHPALANGVIFRPRVVEDDCRSGLFRDQLEGGGEGHAQLFFGWQKIKDLAMVRQIRDRRIPPGIALALAGGNSQFAADVPMQVFGGGLGGLHGQPVEKVCLGIIVRGLKPVEALAGLPADRNHLEGDHVQLA